MGLYEEKDIPGGTVDIDEKSRIVVANWSAFGNVDYDKDVIIKGAYEKTNKERGPMGKGLIYAITDHDPQVSKIIGSIQDLSETQEHLQATIKMANTSWGNDVLEMYKDGIIKQHSVGFVSTRVEEKGEVRIIKEIQLYEGSAVLWGANPETNTVSVSKSLLTADDCDKELNLLMKAWRNGKYTDETFGLIEIRIKQVQKAYHEIAASALATQQPAPEKPTLGESDKLINLLKETRKRLSHGK